MANTNKNNEKTEKDDSKAQALSNVLMEVLGGCPGCSNCGKKIFLKQSLQSIRELMEYWKDKTVSLDLDLCMSHAEQHKMHPEHVRQFLLNLESQYKQKGGATWITLRSSEQPQSEIKIDLKWARHHTFKMLKSPWHVYTSNEYFVVRSARRNHTLEVVSGICGTTTISNAVAHYIEALPLGLGNPLKKVQNKNKSDSKEKRNNDIVKETWKLLDVISKAVAVNAAPTRVFVQGQTASFILEPAICGKCDVAQAMLSRCRACNSIRYCSKKCQIDDWDRHRPHCFTSPRPSSLSSSSSSSSSSKSSC